MITAFRLIMLIAFVAEISSSLVRGSKGYTKVKVWQTNESNCDYKFKDGGSIAVQLKSTTNNVVWKREDGERRIILRNGVLSDKYRQYFELGNNQLKLLKGSSEWIGYFEFDGRHFVTCRDGEPESSSSYSSSSLIRINLLVFLSCFFCGFIFFVHNLNL